MSKPLAVVILAAGMGTRMKSKLPKPLHKAAGRPLVEHVIRASQKLEPERIIVIIGHGAEVARETLSHLPVDFVMQTEQLGTGHALLSCQEALKDFSGNVMVLNGDGPLLRHETLSDLTTTQNDSGAGMSMLICNLEDPYGYGRIVRSADGSVAKIVEHKDATDEERAITEVNPGIYIFDANVFELGQQINNDNASGEYYITDLVDIYIRAGKSVQPVLVDDPNELMGVNDRRQLADIDGILRQRVRDEWMVSGVTMIDPHSIYIDDTAIIENDVVIHPNVWIKGNSVVRAGVEIPPNVVIEDADVGLDMKLEPFTTVKGRVLEAAA